MIFAWLCVDIDGSEYISGNEPKRLTHDSDEGIEIPYWYDDTMIEIPEGTILKITGQELGWDDQPFPLKG